MTSCTNAIKAWETKTGETAAEAVKVDLYAQNPPIGKLDNSLNSLENCEHLALSTNSIDRFIPLPSMKKLKILSAGRNCIKKIEKLDDVAGTLEELWLSYNFIGSLDGLSNMQNLEVLYMSNNKIGDWKEIERLAELSSLREILMIGNPLQRKHDEEGNWRTEVIKRLPNIKTIDAVMVDDDEREAAKAG